MTVFEPPELDRPFTSERDRADAMARFLRAFNELEFLGDFAGLDTLPAHVRSHMSASSLAPGDSIEHRLRRWSNLFSDEITALRDARNRMVHGIAVSDAELKGADWLARQLLRMVGAETAA